jgi:hypothetical protein
MIHTALVYCDCAIMTKGSGDGWQRVVTWSILAWMMIFQFEAQIQ